MNIFIYIGAVLVCLFIFSILLIAINGDLVEKQIKLYKARNKWRK